MPLVLTIKTNIYSCLLKISLFSFFAPFPLSHWILQLINCVKQSVCACFTSSSYICGTGSSYRPEVVHPSLLTILSYRLLDPLLPADSFCFPNSVVVVRKDRYIASPVASQTFYLNATRIDRYCFLDWKCCINIHQVGFHAGPV